MKKLLHMMMLLSLAYPNIFIFELVAKDIIKDTASQTSENKYLIRVDGLACYFCAYGLERHFKKSGKIASFNMDLKKGIVETVLIKGKAVLPIKSIEKYIFDSGFTFRSIKAVFIGHMRKRDNGYAFIVKETGEEFTLKSNELIRKLLKSEKTQLQNFKIVAIVKQTENKMVLDVQEAKKIAKK